EPRSQDECTEHHQARGDDIRSGPEKERLVDGEPTGFTGFEVGPEVGSVKAEEIDVGKDEQHRRPQRRDLGPHVHGDRFELRVGDGHGAPPAWWLAADILSCPEPEGVLYL